MSKFKALMENEIRKIRKIRKAYKYQKEKLDWTFYSEREFIENLLSTRFNYLLIVYSLFITAFANINGTNGRLFILTTGALITTLIWITIYRAYVKLMIYLKILHNMGSKHVFPIAEKEVEKKGVFALFGVNPFIGIYIPFVFVLSFILAIIFVLTGRLSFE